MSAKSSTALEIKCMERNSGSYHGIKVNSTAQLAPFSNRTREIDVITEKSETNGSVAKRACRLASAMQNYGLQPGDKVAIIGPNHLDIVIPYYACHFNGATICTIDPSWTLPDLSKLFETIDPKMVFCPHANSGIVKEALSSNSLDAKIVTFDDPDTSMALFIQMYNGSEVNFRPREFDHSKTTVWLMLTSGTTGASKAAVIPYDTLLNALCSWWSNFTKRIHVTIASSTIQWFSSLMFFISGPLMSFTRVQSSQPMSAEILVKIIIKYKPNAAVWTPFMLSRFLTMATNVDMSSFIYLAIGGSAIEKPLWDKLRARCDAKLYVLYGMTELLCPVFKYDDQITPFGSSGKPLEHLKYKIVDENGNEINTPNKTGELRIKGDGFFKGYYKNDEETKTILTDDNWIKTGDIFYRDEQDFFFFVERQKLLIRYLGFWVSPVQLEEIIKQHPSVDDAIVVGIPDPQVMEWTAAAIVRKNGAQVDPEEIFTLVNNAVPEIKQLHGGLFFIDSIPLTPSGKVHRAKIRDIACEAQRVTQKK